MKKQIVYILTEPIEYEGGVIRGIFSTYEKAVEIATKAYPHTKFKEIKDADYKFWQARHFNIIEVEVDVEVTLFI